MFIQKKKILIIVAIYLIKNIPQILVLELNYGTLIFASHDSVENSKVNDSWSAHLGAEEIIIPYMIYSFL